MDSAPPPPPYDELSRNHYNSSDDLSPTASAERNPFTSEEEKKQEQERFRRSSRAAPATHNNRGPASGGSFSQRRQGSTANNEEEYLKSLQEWVTEKDTINKWEAVKGRPEGPASEPPKIFKKAGAWMRRISNSGRSGREGGRDGSKTVEDEFGGGQRQLEQGARGELVSEGVRTDSNGVVLARRDVDTNYIM